MAISLVAVGGKITAALMNSVITRANAQGTTGIIPTTVAGTGVALGTNGQVTITAATTASINGCFTSTYDNYRVVLNVTTASTANNVGWRLRASGTDDSGADYDWTDTVNSGSAVSSVASAAQTSWVGFNPASSTIAVYDFDFFSPALSVQTSAKGTIHIPKAAAVPAFANTVLTHRLSTAYDGFTLIPSTGTFTGTVRVYGYNNN